ncbi:hypothetical protein [Archaeoglobus sp.]
MFVEINFQMNGKREVKNVKYIIESIGENIISKHETILHEYIRHQVVAKTKFGSTSIFLLNNWEAYAVSTNLIKALKEDLKNFVDALKERNLLTNTKIKIHAIEKYYSEYERVKSEKIKMVLQIIAGLVMSFLSFMSGKISEKDLSKSITLYILAITVFLVLFIPTFGTLERFKIKRILNKYGWSLVD